MFIAESILLVDIIVYILEGLFGLLVIYGIVKLLGKILE